MTRYYTIQEAICDDNTDAAIRLIDSGKFDLGERDPDAGDATLLMAAAQAENIQLIKYLLKLEAQLSERGAGINAIGEDGAPQTALDIALETGNEAVITLLRQAGATTAQEAIAAFGEPCFYDLQDALMKNFENYCNSVYGAPSDAEDLFLSRNHYNGKVMIESQYGDRGFKKKLSSYIDRLKNDHTFIQTDKGICYDTCAFTLPVDKISVLMGALTSAAPDQKKSALSDTFNTVVFTGTLSVDRKTVEAEAKQCGFNVVSDVSKKVDVVVAGDKAGSKVERAKKLGIPVIDELTWQVRVQKGPATR